jgi:anthraniloyl-CoA monooxygenase
VRSDGRNSSNEVANMVGRQAEGADHRPRLTPVNGADIRMRITCIGTDPAALYLGIRLKRTDPSHVIRFIETMEPAPALPVSLVCNPIKPRLELKDAETLAALNQDLVRFDTVTVEVNGRRLPTHGLKFASIDTAVLIERLQGLARGLGCEFERPGGAPASPEDSDLIVVADGPGSAARVQVREFDANLFSSSAKLIAFALDRGCDGLTHAFRAAAGGICHAYELPRGSRAAALVVEAPASVIRANDLDGAPAAQILAFCRALFPGRFDDAEEGASGSTWREFATVRNNTWRAGNRVLLGGAAYTAHFSVDLNVRAWLEDAEALAERLCSGAALPEALKAYEAARRPRAESLQRAAAASQSWFETVHRTINKPLPQFAFSLLTSSMRINYPRIAKAAPDLARSVDDLVAGQPPGSNRPSPPPMLTPFRLRGLDLSNRIVVSPMCMYSATAGTVNDFHLVHLGSRAVGGAGLVLTEMTDVLPEGRISLHCAGMYSAEHVGAWERVVKFVHAHSDSKIGIQLAHAGRKGALTRSWEGHQSLGEAKWEIIAPSPLAFAPGRQVPREMTRADMDVVRDAFARATEMSQAAGFDMIELHFAHGYLISSFISPLSNHRPDEYGGSLANRMRFPLEVFRAVRAAWPADKPISTRISAVDWVEGGTTIEDGIEIARMLHEAGNDILTVSSGGVVSEQPRMDGRLYQASLSDQIRNALGIATMAVGGIVSHGDANTMVAAGRADLCALARGYLVDPYFVRHAAHAQNQDANWPSQYRRAREVRLRGA